jgi:hypothetical protein
MLFYIFPVKKNIKIRKGVTYWKYIPHTVGGTLAMAGWGGDIKRGKM